MHMAKKSWANIVYACILLAAVIGLFGWYSAANDQRIKNKNRVLYRRNIIRGVNNEESGSYYSLSRHASDGDIRICRL